MFFCQAGSGQICPIEQTARNVEVIDLPASGPAPGPACCCGIYYNLGEEEEEAEGHKNYLGQISKYQYYSLSLSLSILLHNFLPDPT